MYKGSEGNDVKRRRIDLGGKLRAILYIEARYNELSKILENKHMVPRAEAQGFITDEKFGIIKDRRSVELGP